MSENANIRWYVVHTYSGYETKVRDNLIQAVKNNGMQDQIVDVRIPVEDVIEIKNDRRRTVQRKLLPSYVMVKMEMTNETWYLVRNTRGVTGFVGPGSKPEPLSDEDFERIFSTAGQTRVEIKVGDNVRILSGTFKDFNGRVAEVDASGKNLKVMVPMLTREVPVELAADEVIPVESGSIEPQIAP